MKSLFWSHQKGKLLLAISALIVLIGLGVFLHEPEQPSLVVLGSDCVDSEHVRCWSGDLSTTSDESIEDLCRELAEAQNM